MMTQEELFALDEQDDTNDKQEDIIEDIKDDIDPIKEFLSLKGVQNGTIKYEEEDGTVVDKDFNDLEKQEQLNILKELFTNEDKEEYKWQKTDKEILDYVKDNNLSLTELIANEVSRLQNEVQPITSVSAMSNDEIFIKDLKDRLGDVDDEYITDALEKAKKDPYYDKKIDSIKKDFMAIENNIKQQEEDRIYQQQLEEYNKQVNNINNSITNIDNIHGFEIDNDIKVILADQLTNLNDNGETVFTEWINNPDNAIKAVWYANYGDQAFNMIQEHYETKLREAEQLGYNKAKKEFENTVNRLPEKPLVNTEVVDINKNNNDTLTVTDLYNNYDYK